MNVRFLPILALTTSLHAGEPRLEEITTPHAEDSPWRIGAGYAQLLGLKSEFTGLGTFRNPNTPQPLGGGLDRDYDNGFVHVDSSGPLSGGTWNWSYDSNAQYDPSGTGSINYSITNSLSNARAEEEGAARPGVELFALYDMGAAGFNGSGSRPATWGFRAGLQYSHVGLSNQDLLTTGLTTTTDSFDLAGSIPPLAPYTGSFGGPGAVLSDTPTRSTVAGGSGLVRGSREFDVDLTLLNLGGYLDIPLTRKLDLLLEGGVSLGVASGSYNFHSATTLTGLGTQISHGSDSSTDLLPGLYLGLGATYQLNGDWSLLANGRYQYLQSYDLGANGSQASLSFDSAFVLSLSGVYSF